MFDRVLNTPLQYKRRLNFYFLFASHQSMGFCVSPPRTWVLSRPRPQPNLYLTAPALNFCLDVLRFTVEVCYSQPRLQCVFSFFFFSKLLWGRGCVVVSVSTNINSASHMCLLFKYNVENK